MRTGKSRALKPLMRGNGMTSERRRLAALRGYAILDSAAEPDFDELIERVATTFDMPCAMLSFIDANRQWHKARVGVLEAQIPRAVSLCTHSILNDGVTVLPDARADVRFADHALVTAMPGIRFYAAAPLRTAEGAAIGTVCVFDHQPHPPLSGQGQLQRASFAAEAMDLLERRLVRLAA